MLGDPVNAIDPSGQYVGVVIEGVEICLANPFCSAAAFYVAECVFGNLVSRMAKGGKQRITDTGLEGASTDELLTRVRDKTLPGKEKLRIIKELKARGQRNQQKRQSD